MSDLVSALEALWCIPHSGPDNLFASPAYKAVGEICTRRFGMGGYSSALYNVLRSAGVPLALPAAQRHLTVSPEEAAVAIERSFTRSSTIRRHLCPLDLADELPELSFGPSRVSSVTADELATLFDAPRLTRFFPGRQLDLRRLAQFSWLVVEEVVAVDPRAEARAMSFLFTTPNTDFGEVDPHKGRFPAAVTDALFCLLLAEWEEWGRYVHLNWRGFEVPWIYTLDEDWSVRPQVPPDADSLSWEPWIIDDDYEGQIELERPTVLPLDLLEPNALTTLNDMRWRAVLAARQTPLFTTPVAHFLVHAFHETGIDELLAHITTIEAALGLQADFRVGNADPFPKIKSTRRLMARIGALLNEKAAAVSFKALFDLRSQFVHGRAGVKPISSKQRVEARKLARRVSSALVDVATGDQRSREEILAELLARGVALNMV